MPVASFADELWRSLGFEGTADFEVTGSGALPSAYRVTDLAVGSIGVAGLAAAELIGRMTGTDARPAVSVDRTLASAWFGSAVQPVGWTLPDVWDPISGRYRTRDGWIRLHTNAPHHRAAALAVLDEPADLTRVRRAVERWSAEELEQAIVDAGGCAAALRSREEWLAHPQGIAVSAEPLVDRATGSAGGISARWRPTVERPLAGLRVLDLTRVIAGPVATRFLAGLGADVLRIDPPHWEEDALVPNMTLGKRSARLDARTEAGSATLRSLIADCDVMVHGYRNGALASLGIDADIRQSLRPGLVEVSLDAYGFTGPWSRRRGFDSLVQMSVGIADRGREWARSEQPTPLPVQALDHTSGYLLAAAALRGILDSVETGQGSRSRTSLARVAETLIAGGEQPVDTEIVERATPQLPLIAPQGPAVMLASPVTVGGAGLRFDLPPTVLGSSQPTWER